jgi:hypothetical protein
MLSFAPMRVDGEMRDRMLAGECSVEQRSLGSMPVTPCVDLFLKRKSVPANRGPGCKTKMPDGIM